MEGIHRRSREFYSNVSCLHDRIQVFSLQLPHLLVMFEKAVKSENTGEMDWVSDCCWLFSFMFPND